MGLSQSKKRCKICSTKNKEKRSHICEECNFIPSYITKYGRENLKRILNNSYQDFENPIQNDSNNECDISTIKQPQNKSRKIEIMTVHQPSAPHQNEESTTDDYNIKPLARCKSVNCSCKERQTSYRTSIYNPPSYPQC
jgi:hypothetical protein